MKDMFLLFLVVRPGFIICYTTATAICSIIATDFKTKKIKEEKLKQKKKKKRTPFEISEDDSGSETGIFDT